jgi:hypothetical protein
VLAVSRKRRFLDAGREGGGLAEFEAEVVEVGFRRRMGAEFVDDGSEIGQRPDRGQSRCICWASQAAQRPEEQRSLHYVQGHAIIKEAAGEPLIRNTGPQRVSGRST